MWFDSWADLGRILIVGVAAYVLIVCVLRVSGKRTLSQLNAFDFIVTVALGSTLATILLSSDVSWSEGALALALLAGLQLGVALISSRVGGFRRLVTARPAVVLTHGQMHGDALRKNRLAESDVLQATRSSGIGGVELTAAVVLEANGTLSVISEQQFGTGSALQHLQ
ncbi:DUF421 domain-containing protein [Curtobacterium sp. VKM Ac-1393]|nr:DUF421 domain-containing protein [Curtobacterium sp. VKM Ac-1393]